MKTNLTRQYEGFIESHNLWKGKTVFDIEQLEIESQYFEIKYPEKFNEIRLGKRVEEFFNFQVKSSSSYEMLANNIQINNHKLTIGELDALIKAEDKTMHVEIIYKFYLYDSNIHSENELDRWIGPNRKDSLIFKLKKLKGKQLPLLYSKYCRTFLENLNLNPDQIHQRVCYKAQLFLPFNTTITSIKPLDKSCIKGYYLSFLQIEKLKGFEIYIPDKLDWLITPYSDVTWLSFYEGKKRVETFILEKRSPMVWLKASNHTFQKCFITFW